MLLINGVLTDFG